LENPKEDNLDSAKHKVGLADSAQLSSTSGHGTSLKDLVDWKCLDIFPVHLRATQLPKYEDLTARLLSENPFAKLNPAP
jgi:hypothetical protein